MFATAFSNRLCSRHFLTESVRNFLASASDNVVDADIFFKQAALVEQPE